MSINPLLVSTEKNQLWHHFKPYWRASVKEQNQLVFNNRLKKDIYCQQRTGRLSSVTTERCDKNEPEKARRVSEINQKKQWVLWEADFSLVVQDLDEDTVGATSAIRVEPAEGNR